MVVGVLLSGCTPTPSEPQATRRETIGEIPVILVPDQVVLPIDSYLPSVDQTVAIMLVAVELLNQCVRAEGGQGNIHYLVYDSAGIASPAGQGELTSYVASSRRDSVIRNGMWQFFDPDNAATYGYQSPPDQWTALSSSLSLDNPLHSTCLARVNSVVPGGQMLSPFSVSELPDNGSQWHPDDSRYQAVAAQWSGCMKDSGFDYPTPREAIAENYQMAANDRARAVAVADVKCKLSTNLVGVAVAVQSAYDQEYIDTHVDQLAALQVYIADFLAGRVTVPETLPSASPS